MACVGGSLADSKRAHKCARHFSTSDGVLHTQRNRQAKVKLGKCIYSTHLSAGLNSCVKSMLGAHMDNKRRSVCLFSESLPVAICTPFALYNRVRQRLMLCFGSIDCTHRPSLVSGCMRSNPARDSTAGAEGSSVMLCSIPRRTESPSVATITMWMTSLKRGSSAHTRNI